MNLEDREWERARAQQAEPTASNASTRSAYVSAYMSGYPYLCILLHMYTYLWSYTVHRTHYAAGIEHGY